MSELISVTAGHLASSPAPPPALLASVRRSRRRGPYGAGLILLALALLAVFAPAVTSVDPARPRLSYRLQPPSWIGGASTSAVMGTDNLGRDVWSRIAFGSRVAVVIGVVSVVIAGAIGVLAGVVAGYFRGWVDEVIMFVTDIQLACPFLLLAIALAAVLGPSLRNAIVALAVAAWPTYCRIVRSEVLSLREKDFIQASVASGASSARIICDHILPNVTAQIIVVATLMVSRMIVLEASLSFLGLGVQPPTPSWGVMISDSRDYVNVGWWLATFPGCALTLTVLSINQVGDWLRDRLDPRLGRGGLE